MYKEIFRWVIAIISQPAKAWVLLAKKGEKQEEFLSRFVYSGRIVYAEGV